MDRLFTSEHHRRFVDQLREYGVERYIELPQVAVVGDQSSGKSSVLTAIAERVEFPSSSTVTTLCPTQVVLHGRKGELEILFHRRRAENGGEPAEKPERKKLESWGDMAGAIKEVQDGIDKKQFISADSIVFEISGEGLPDVTLIDLPGIFRTTTREQDASVIPRVKDMIMSYMNQTRTLILAVIAGSNDLQVSEIIGWARKVDPLFKRTLFVVTKLDLMEPGTERRFLEAAKDFDATFHYVVCRGQEKRDKGVSAQAWKAEEAKFFAKEPWNSIPKNSVGIEALQGKLASHLARRVQEELPKIRVEVMKLLEEAERRLAEFGPDLSTDALRRVEFGNALNTLTQVYGCMVKGDYGAHDLLAAPDARLAAKLRALSVEFAADISALSAEPQEYAEGDCVRLLSNSEDWDAFVRAQAPHATKEQCASPFFRWQKRESAAGAAEGQEATLELVHDVTRVVVNDRIPRNLFTSPAVCYLMKQMRESRGPELPGFLSFQVFTAIVQSFIRREWVSRAGRFVSDTCAGLSTALQMAARAASSRTDGLSRFFGVLAEQEVDKFRVRLERQIGAAVAQELQPHTQNHYYFDNISHARAERITRAVAEMRGDEMERLPKRAVLDAVARASGIDRESNDECEAEDMSVCLRSYLKVARKRFIDVAIGFVHHELQSVLTDKSVLATTDAQLKRVLDDPHATGRRAQLQQKVRTLQEAKRAFDNRESE
jgi:hypothetical protein